MSTEEEVLGIKLRLEGMIGSNQIDEETSIDLLNQLKSLKIDLNILKTTGIGILVNNMRKLTDSNRLESSSKNLLKNWKKLITNNKNNYNNSFEISKNLVTNDELRLKCRTMLAQAIESDEPQESHSSFCDVNLLASKCEQAVYEEFDKKIDTKYKNRIKSIILNLKDSKNQHLRQNILLGYLKPEKLALMTCEEMANDKLKQLRAELTKEAIFEHQLAYIEGSKTKQIKCKTCGKNNIIFDEILTRDIEEPLVFSACCQECGHKWQFS